MDHKQFKETFPDGFPVPSQVRFLTFMSPTWEEFQMRLNIKKLNAKRNAIINNPEKYPIHLRSVALALIDRKIELYDSNYARKYPIRNMRYV